jgi:hypothetical protein
MKFSYRKWRNYCLCQVKKDTKKGRMEPDLELTVVMERVKKKKKKKKRELLQKNMKSVNGEKSANSTAPKT